ncbi:MAG: RHS repeat-associated core domain-containing protein [Deltaproteobacteria bacterium]|nr:RHS repeat-associated core domain-containing protein [Deltaproteobacteria bacterium]
MRFFVSIFLLGLLFDVGVYAEGALYFHEDHLGSGVVRTDSGGKVRELLVYTPYGEVIIPSPQGGEGQGEGDSYLYTGQELDRDTEIYSYGARCYDPALSRFLSIDPIEENPPYSYTYNNPVVWTDPDGQAPASVVRPKSNLALTAGELAIMKEVYEAVKREFEGSTNAPEVARRLKNQGIDVTDVTVRNYAKTEFQLRPPRTPYHKANAEAEEVVAAAFKHEGNLTAASKELLTARSPVLRRLQRLKVGDHVRTINRYRVLVVEEDLGKTVWEFLRGMYPTLEGIGIPKGLTWVGVKGALKKNSGAISPAARDLGVEHKTVQEWIEGNYRLKEFPGLTAGERLALYRGNVGDPRRSDWRRPNQDFYDEMNRP